MTAPALTEPLFHCTALPAAGDVVLAGSEAHHVTVQRLRAGNTIALFDGRGNVARGTIAAIQRDAVHIAIEQRRHEPPPAPALDLYCAIPKGDRLTVLLDMATQLGMSRFTPLRWRRSVAEPGARAEERWRRICLEACKQSRRLYLPEIAPSSEAANAAAGVRAQGDLLLAAHPDAAAEPLLSIEPGNARRIALFVGPEGGIAPEEAAMLRASGARLIHLGPAILRIETAAVSLLTLARTLLDARRTP